MGKRKKSSRGPTKKVKQTLDTTFSCLFCNHENSVACTMDKKSGIGSLYCKVCGQSFQAPINALSAPIDVYSEWIDACEAVQGKEPADIKAEDDGYGRDIEEDDEEEKALSDLDEDEFA
ncbi:transcription elongation factor 1 [Trichomonascus vanleenenianus]|uniref:Elf1p n=1 Tax=Trichomonascus vanleenenianus TaxID=2268995 RepID=UPI003ECB6133